MTLEQVNKKINAISMEVQGIVDKGWVCGETKMPLSTEHQQRLIAEAQAKVNKLTDEFNRQEGGSGA